MYMRVKFLHLKPKFKRLIHYLISFFKYSLSFLLVAKIFFGVTYISQWPFLSYVQYLIEVEILPEISHLIIHFDVFSRLFNTNFILLF